MVQKSPVYAILCTLEQQRTVTDKQEHKLLPVYKLIGIAHKAGGRTILNDKEVINDVLVNLFNEIMELEGQAIITDEYKDITNNVYAYYRCHWSWRKKDVRYSGRTEYYGRLPDHCHECTG